MKKYIAYIITILFPVAICAQTIIPNGNTAPQLPLPAVPAAYDANIKVNFVRTWESRQAVTDGSSASLNNNTNFKTATGYFDGLGRPLQTVVKGNNYDGTKDIVSINMYDEFGREVKQYLPYAPPSGNDGKFRLNTFAEQQAYYHANYQDQTPFSRTEIEASPLNRSLKTFAPGNNWAGGNRGVEQQFAVNTQDDGVRMATIGYVSSSVPVFGELYPAGDLLKSIATDEHGKKVVEYKTKQGQVILKKVQLSDAPGISYTGWLSTLYVYDDFGKLRFIIQPKGVEELLGNGWLVTATVRDELCFIYEYDTEGRLMYRKMPGADAVYLCYDKWDRVVFTQDGKMRSQNQWLVTWYDNLNRTFATALYNATKTQAQMQAMADAIYELNPVPQLDEFYLTRLTYTYYDEYTMPGMAAYNQSMVNTVQSNISAGDEAPDVLNKTELVRGMVTGAQTRAIGTTTFLKSTTYYDTKGRALQTQSTNIKGGMDAATMVYSFTGKVLSSYLQHNNPAAKLPGTQTTNIYTRNVYNNDYLLKTEKKINNGNWQRVAEIQYDDMGKPKKKMMGSPASNFYVNMDYNIRGWLTGINKAAQQNLENGSIGPSTFYDAIFSEALHYDHGYSKQNYNGNISGIKWANASDKQARSYGYDYDNANRLMQADFTQKNSSAWNTNAGIDYSLMWMRYDANGNIFNLAQKALKLNNSAEIDRLKYDYLPYSNKLNRVTDTLNDAGTKLGDFKDGTNTGDDYAYDANGSMTLDNNKSISSITYNYLNLPQTIMVTGKGTIEYMYDASGNKLQKKVTEGTTITTTDYVSGFVYHNDTLQFTGHEEGRIRYAKKYYYTGDSAYEWHYDYFYKDHLGNIRAVVTEQKDTMKYMATFETANREKENALFANIEETAFSIRDITKSILEESCLCVLNPDGIYYPEDNTTSPNEYVSRLNGTTGKRIGASITLKVMAGDHVDLGVKVWYPDANVPGSTNSSGPEDVLPSLINTLSGATSGLSGGKATTSELSATTSPFWAGIQSFLDTHTESENDPENPKAYLNWILFDEQFKYVPEGSGFIAVPGFSFDIQTMANNNLPIVKSGYLFVYLSNETEKRDVFFDNLVVQHRTGPLSETTDYTAWGLDMKMIGSKAFGRLENKKKYNGIEQTTDLDLNQYDAFFRNLDPQTGRWWQLDPKPDFSTSPFSSMDNNPVKLTDFLGDVSGPGPGDPPFKIPPIFWDESKNQKIHEIDRKYSNTARGKKHTIKLTIYNFVLPVKFLVMRYEANPAKQKANRDANIAANPTKMGNRTDKTAGHEVPYASTKEGGRYAMREITDASENSSHGALLTAFYKKNNMKDGDIFLVPIYDPENGEQRQTQAQAAGSSETVIELSRVLTRAPSASPAPAPTPAPARARQTSRGGPSFFGIVRRLSLITVCIEATINSLSEKNQQQEFPSL